MKPLWNSSRKFALERVDERGELRQVRGGQRQRKFAGTAARERMRIAHVNGEEGHLRHAERARQSHEVRQLAVVGSLQGHAQADRGTARHRRADALADLVEGVESADGLVGGRLRAVHGDGDGVTQRRGRGRVLGQRQPGSQQPDIDAGGTQAARDRLPFGIHQRFAAGEQRHARAQRLQVRQHARAPNRASRRAAVTPVVAGHAARIAALREVERHQRQRALSHGPHTRSASAHGGNLRDPGNSRRRPDRCCCTAPATRRRSGRAAGAHPRSPGK